MARRVYIALPVLVAAVALGACGGNNDDSATDTSTNAGVIQPQGATGQSGATGATGTERAGTKRSAKSKERSDKQAGAGGGNSGSAAPTAPTDQQPPPQPRTLTPAELKQVGRQQAEQARILCKAAGLEGLAQRYGIKNPDPDEVAKAYAAAYLVGLRDAVERGCKAGLREAK